MQSFKSQIQQLWSIKSDVQETVDSLLDLNPEPGDVADSAVKTLYDVLELVEEAIDNLAFIK